MGATSADAAADFDDPPAPGPEGSARRPGSVAGGFATAAPPASPAAAVRESDAALVELLRTEETPGVGDLAEALGVTATAVRQRLDRLMRDGIVARELVGSASGAAGARPRGRPAYGYRLTDKGRRTGGDNFRDLAMVLWREVRGVKAPEVRRGLVSRVGSAMARLYQDRITGQSVSARLDDAARIMMDRQIACVVEPADPSSGKPAVLTTHVCPYPELAEGDRGICAAERLMLQEMVGAQVTLASCRLDGSDCCRFTVAAEPHALTTPHPLPVRPESSGEPAPEQAPAAGKKRAAAGPREAGGTGPLPPP